MATATLVKTTSATGTAAPRPEPATSESRIDGDSHFNGLFETRQNLRIEGVAEGEIRCEGTLTVAEGARVKAKVTANTITIAGELEGEVVCQGVFQIMPSGQVVATVSARRLIVQEGGFYNGEFHMITEKPAGNELLHVASRRSAASEKEGNGKDRPDADGEPGNLLSSDEWWAKMAGSEPPKSDSGPKPA